MSAVSLEAKPGPKRRVKQPATGKYKTPREYAAELRCDRSTVTRWIKDGLLFALNLRKPDAKIDRFLIPADAILAFEQKFGTCPRPKLDSSRPKESAAEGRPRRYGTVAQC